MANPIDAYHEKRLAEVKAALEANHFEACIAADAEAARERVLGEIIPATGAASFSWGGSVSLAATGLVEAVKANPKWDCLDTFDKTLTPEEKIERRRRALLVDCFLTGSNAVTETGVLVNLDMIGNRVGAVAFGPKHVVLIVGRNKIAPDVDEAVFRIKNYAAPVNAMRLKMKTPCAKTGRCGDCGSPERICNVWTIIEKSFPKGRIKVVLVNQDLGF